MVTVGWSPYFDENLKESGFFTALVKAAFQAGGHDAGLRFLPWTRAMALVERAEEDVLMGAYFTEERVEAYRYSDPIYSVKVVVAGHQRTALRRYSSLRDLTGYRIAIVLGWSYGERFDAAHYLTKETAHDHIASIRKLYGGRVDLIAGSEVVIRHTIRQMPDLDLKKIRVLSPPLTEENLYIMVSRKLPDGKALIEDFNRGLATIKRNGTFQAILRRFEVSS